ncbi:Uncharacterised protein [Vibrio cholerae]|nr:Uncharacterised protein [Vibrio cholerae]
MMLPRNLRQPFALHWSEPVCKPLAVCANGVGWYGLIRQTWLGGNRRKTLLPPFLIHLFAFCQSTIGLLSIKILEKSHHIRLNDL